MTHDEISNIEEVWRKDTPGCLSCGWCPAFYEIEDLLTKDGVKQIENFEVYWAPCINPEDNSDHRGHYVYVPKIAKTSDLEIKK